MINKFLKYIWRDGECICTKSKSNYYSNHLHDFRKNCLIKMILQCRCWEVLFVHIVFIILLQKKSRFNLNIILNKLMYQVGFQKWKQKKFQLQCIYHLLSNCSKLFLYINLDVTSSCHYLSWISNISQKWLFSTAKSLVLCYGFTIKLTTKKAPLW